MKNNLRKKEKGEERLEGTPWCNGDGTPKTDEEIRELGKNWSAETWDRYLRADVGDVEDDALVFFSNMDTGFVLGRHEVVDILKEHGDYGGIRFAVRAALDELPPMGRTVIEYAFWKGMDDKGIAEGMGKTHGHVRVCKSRALKRLGEILPSKRFRLKVARLMEEQKFGQKLLKAS